MSDLATFGLSRRMIELLTGALARFPQIVDARIFGSRSMGNFKNGSDIDMAIFGPELDEPTVRRLSTLLNEELPIPHRVDVVWYDACDNEELKAHIRAHGRRFLD
ncbi:MAG: nucleotidyltransferase domain-containing protein [Rectinemataceae bacterium]